MKTILSLASPADIDTECLVVIALDHGSSKNGVKDKPEVSLATSDSALREAAQDVIASGEITGKLAETTLLHKPAKLRAKRLLLLGGGKAKHFTSVELRKLAGTAARFLKPKGIRSLAL